MSHSRPTSAYRYAPRGSLHGVLTEHQARSQRLTEDELWHFLIQLLSGAKNKTEHCHTTTLPHSVLFCSVALPHSAAERCAHARARVHTRHPSVTEHSCRGAIHTQTASTLNRAPRAHASRRTAAPRPLIRTPTVPQRARAHPGCANTWRHRPPVHPQRTVHRRLESHSRTTRAYRPARPRQPHVHTHTAYRAQ